MNEIAIVALTTLFATIGPLDVAAMFAAMTPNTPLRERRSMALRGTAISLAILLLFAFTGEILLISLGISLAALKVAGGILLLLIGIEMVFARASGSTSTTAEEIDEAVDKEDVTVFPLATPLIAGPGTIGAIILLMSEAAGDWMLQMVIIGALIAILLLTLCLLLLANQVQRLLGITGMQVISRVFGVLLAALAVQFMFDGIAQSGLLGR